MTFLFRLIISYLVLSLCPSARAEYIFEHVKPGFTSLALLRGSIDFTLVHPLKILHGHVEHLTGEVNFNPGDLSQGVQLIVRGKRTELTFDEREGGIFLGKISAADWTFESRAMFMKAFEHNVMVAGKNYFAGWFASGNIGHPMLVPASCEAESDSFQCKWEETVDVSRWDWDLPTLLMLPISQKIAVRGSLQYGEKAQ